MNNITKIHQRNTASASADSEVITDATKIARLLKKMTLHYSPLTVQIHGHKVFYMSSVVGVDKKHLLLDELMPNTGNQRLQDTGKIHAVGKLDGVDISFTTTLHRVDKQKNILTYYMKLPEKLEYRQRRMAFRVRIPVSKRLYVLIDNGSDTILRGELHDLSHGGAGKIIPDVANNIKLGRQYECAIELPGNKWLYVTVEMCYKKTIPSRKRQLIGAQFAALTDIQSRLIGRCINELEIEQLRKRSAFNQ